MEQVQAQHERAVGDAFIAWLNARDGSRYSFACRGDQAPDLIYQSENARLGIEVVGAYYDHDDALFQWQNARRRSDAPTSWFGVNFDDALRRNVELCISEKCAKSYGDNCLLLVSVLPALTLIPDMRELLASVTLPAVVPFAGIYVAGEFPGSSSALGGYYAWQLWPATR